MQKPIQKHRKITHAASKTRKVRYSGRRRGAKTRRRKARGGVKRRTRGGVKRRTRGGGKRRTRGGVKRTIRGGMWKRLPGEAADVVGPHKRGHIPPQSDELGRGFTFENLQGQDPFMSFQKGDRRVASSSIDVPHPLWMPDSSPDGLPREEQERQQELPEGLPQGFGCGCQPDPELEGEYFCTCGNNRENKPQARQKTKEWLENIERLKYDNNDLNEELDIHSLTTANLMKMDVKLRNELTLTNAAIEELEKNNQDVLPSRITEEYIKKEDITLKILRIEIAMENRRDTPNESLIDKRNGDVLNVKQVLQQLQQRLQLERQIEPQEEGEEY